MTECVVCGKHLTGGVDTFGDMDALMCWDCHSELLFEQAKELRIRRDELRASMIELDEEIADLKRQRQVAEDVLFVLS